MITINDNLDYTKKNVTNDFYINKRLAEILKNNSVLNVFITSQKKAYALNIVYEDDEHTVIKKQYTILSKNVMQKTDINTPYISLTNNGIIYYTPYKNSQED